MYASQLTQPALQLDEQLSTAILRQAREQQAELNQEDLAGRGLSGIMQASSSSQLGQLPQPHPGT